MSIVEKDDKRRIFKHTHCSRKMSENIETSCRQKMPNSIEKSSKDASNIPERKRRMSKQERKALKKKKGLKNNNLACIEESDTDILKMYEPIDIPLEPSSDLSTLGDFKKVEAKSNDVGEGGEENDKSLGKWFPNALLIKCAVNYTNTGRLLMNDDTLREENIFVREPKASLLLFYQYTRNGKWSQNQLKLLMTYLSKIAKKRHIGGRIRVSQEGVNATISAIDLKDISARETLRFIAKDFENFDSNVFTSETDFKYIDNLKADRHFKELKIIPVQELVFYGIKEDEARLDQRGGIHLDAEKYHEMLKKENTVVIDVRNHYETVIGRFDGQEKKKAGAEYLDPKMRKSTDFKSWLETPETQKKLANKTVL